MINNIEYGGGGMYEIYVVKDGKEIFLCYANSLSSVEKLKEKFGNIKVYKVIGDFNGTIG